MKNADIEARVPSSFRDPNGFVFPKDGSLFRCVCVSYREDYDHLMKSGLYKHLVDRKLLIPHEESDWNDFPDLDAYKIIKPEQIPFLSYPYEWCFSQLKDSALLTLQIQKQAIQFGMSLKDASAYNIQFRKGKPILIDTLSFEKYREGQPWVAYRQFCQHFLAPLSLMSFRDIRLSQLLRTYIDGIPLDLASDLLPFPTYGNFLLLSNIHLHARSEQHFKNKSLSTSHLKMSRQGLLGLIDHLESGIKKMKWQSRESAWKDYYLSSPYSALASIEKKRFLIECLNKIMPRSVWDLGANTGLFSRLASTRGIHTIALDSDPASVERNYLECVEKEETHLLPLWVDLTNPSSSIGWENEERMSLIDRGPADLTLALALLHHLTISNNLPFDKIASFFSRICRFLIIEFVPKTDPQTQKLLANRTDIFTVYTQESFEKAFKNYFEIEKTVSIKGSERTLYLMKNNASRDEKSL